MLSDEQIEAYRCDGFVIAPGVLTTAEIEALRSESVRLLAELARDPTARHAHWRRHDRLGRIADRLDPVRTVSRAFAKIADDERLVATAASAIGEPATLFKDKLITKPPGTHGYGLHRDFAYWADLGIPADVFVTLFVVLDPCGAENGGIELFPARHTGELPADPNDPLDVDPRALEGAASVTPSLNAGDVLVFHGLTPHRSGPNRGAGPRRVYLPTYVSRRYAVPLGADAPERRAAVYRALGPRVARPPGGTD